MFNKLRNRIKTKVEQKAADIVLTKIAKNMNTSNTSWKTSLAAAITGLIPIVNSVIEAYQQGAFTGKSATQVAIGVGIIVLGFLAKDKDKTGLPGSNQTTQP